MNKQALKLKKKRRLEKENEKLRKINKAWDEMNDYIKSHNLPELKKTKEQMVKVYKTAENINSKILEKSGVISLVCSLVTLIKKYSYNTDEILDYSKKLKNCINRTITSNHAISNILEEIEHDYNVDILSRCNDLPKIDTFYIRDDMNKSIISATVKNFPYFIALNAYTHMNLIMYSNQKSWNKDDLTIFISNCFKEYKNILIDNKYLEILRDFILSNTNIYVDLNNGNVKEIINKF